MAGSSFDSNTLVGQRVAIAAGGGDMLLSAAIDEGDIKINGQDVGAIAADASMEDILKAINDNVDNVTASGFNVVTAKNAGNGVTTVGQLVIEALEQGQTTVTTFAISASANMTELVANINKETGGVISASLNSEGKLVLSNDTGAAIHVHDNSASSANLFDGGSGFKDADMDYGGFIKLTADDSNPVRIERGNLSGSTPGSATDLAGLGFRETTSETDDDAYTMTGIQLTTAGATTAWTQTDLTINGVAIYDACLLYTSPSPRDPE